MALPRPIRSIGRRHSGPIPVPEIGTDSASGRQHPPFVLLFRTGAIGLVVILGVASSGLAASRYSASPNAKSGMHATNNNQRPASPSVALAPVGSSTATAVQPATSTVPSTVSPSTVRSPAATTPTTAVPSVGPSVPNSPIISSSGTKLYLNGSPYHFVGVNAYEAGTEWGTNAGCGAELSNAQLNQLFASLPPNSLVRFWAFQETIATNINTHQLDWGPLDRIFAAAAANNQRLIVVISGQGSGCDGGHWQDPSWYAGGFNSVFNNSSTTDGKGLMPLSYGDYLRALVSRYASSPALGMWEPMSEAEASTCPPEYEPINCSGHQTCPDEAVAATSLRYFFDTVGSEIHTLDPRHLVESGLLGGGQCGTQGSDYQYVSASPGIDVLSYHDYYGTVALGGDQWNGLAVRFAQMASLDKPIIAGETGLMAGTGAGCTSDAERNSAFAAKDQAQLAAGDSGALFWDWVPTLSSTCSYDIAPTDAIMQPGGAVG